MSKRDEKKKSQFYSDLCHVYFVHPSSMLHPSTKFLRKQSSSFGGILQKEQ